MNLFPWCRSPDSGPIPPETAQRIVRWSVSAPNLGDEGYGRRRGHNTEDQRRSPTLDDSHFGQVIVPRCGFHHSLYIRLPERDGRMRSKRGRHNPSSAICLWDLASLCAEADSLGLVGTSLGPLRAAALRGMSSSEGGYVLPLQSAPRPRPLH